MCFGETRIKQRKIRTARDLHVDFDHIKGHNYVNIGQSKIKYTNINYLYSLFVKLVNGHNEIQHYIKCYAFNVCT
jgi:hypothetical protein